MPTVPENVLVTVRKKSGSNQIVLHLLNRGYDPTTKSVKVLSNVDVSLDRTLISPTKPYARLLSYDMPPQHVGLTQQAATLRLQIPELWLWTLVVLE